MNIKDKILRYYEKYMFFMGASGHLIFVFQTYRILINESSADVSLEGFLIASLSILSWLFYGFLKNDWVLMGVNLFGLIASLVCILAIVANR